jgi:hypothetical protein
LIPRYLESRNEYEVYRYIFVYLWLFFKQTNDVSVMITCVSSTNFLTTSREVDPILISSKMCLKAVRFALNAKNIFHLNVISSHDSHVESVKLDIFSGLCRYRYWRWSSTFKDFSISICKIRWKMHGLES